jgi:hypothetical protein
VPDAPIEITVDSENTSATKISFNWVDGTSNGGSAVIDYSIYYDQATGTWVELKAGISEKSYSTHVTITEGYTYAFKVRARNSVGYGILSAQISILAAQIPD